MNRSSSLANIGIKRDTSTEPEKRNRDERSSLNSKVPGHTMSHKTLDTGDQKSHVCISERTSSKFEIGTLPNSVNSLTKPALVVTISPGKVVVAFDSRGISRRSKPITQAAATLQ